jgi:hypothetical protein
MDQKDDLSVNINNEFSVLQDFWKFSDKYPRDTFRFWFSHVLYNLVKDACYFLKIRKF